MTFYNKDLGDIFLDYALSSVLSIASPTGTFQRLSPFVDEVFNVRTKHNPDSFGTPTMASEQEIVLAYAETYKRIQDVVEQLSMSMKFATPSLAVLMERDVAYCAIGVISQNALESLEEWTRRLKIERPELDEEEALILITEEATKIFGGGGAMSPQAASYIQHVIGGAGQWYIEPVLALAESLGADVEPPEVEDPNILSWLGGTNE